MTIRDKLMTTSTSSVHQTAPTLQELGEHRDTSPTSGASSQVPSGVTFQIAVNRTYRGKPAPGAAFNWKRYNRAFRPATLTLEQLAHEIRRGFAIAPLCRGNREKANFQAAQHIGLDFDTETDACRLDILAADPFIAQYAAIIHTTASHKTDKPRARVLFVLERAITDAALLARFIAALLARYTLADPKAKDVARLFFGAVDCDLRILGNVLPISVLEALRAEHERQQPPSRPRPRTLTPPTDRTKAWAHGWAERRLDKVAATHEGGRNDELYRAAFAIGQLDAAGLLNAEDWRDPLIGAGRSAGLGEHECITTARSGLDGGKALPADWVPDFELSRRRDNSETTAPHIARYSRVFPDGPPTTLLRKLRMLHKIQPVENHAPCETVLSYWQHIVEAGVLPDDAIMTDADFLRAARQLNPKASRKAVERGLQQVRALEFVSLFSLEASGDNASTEKRDKVRFQFLPWPDQLRSFERHWRYIVREYAYRRAPDDVQPEYGHLDSEQTARLDAARAPMYERWADARLEAKITESAHLTRLERDIAKIAAGNYRPVRVPIEALRNVSTYKQALAVRRLEAQRDKGLRAGRLAFELGVTVRTVRNMAERDDRFVLKEQTGTPALEDLNDYQRDNLPYLTVGKPAEGMVTLKAEPRVMLREYADETDCAAHDERVREKREAAAQRAAEAAPPPAPDERGEEAPPPPPPVRRVTIYADYSDGHKLRQLLWTPGAMDLPRYDAEGVYYTPDELWRMMADAPPAPQERAVFEHLVTQAALGKGDMGTFAAYSEPRERGDDEQETGPAPTDAEGTERPVGVLVSEARRNEGGSIRPTATAEKETAPLCSAGRDGMEGQRRLEGDNHPSGKGPAGHVHVWALNWNIAKRRQTWCPPPGVDLLLDFCVAELGGVVVEPPAAVGKPHSDNRNEGQQSAISSPNRGDE